MKWIFLILLVLPSAWAAADEGPWSAPVGGLRARLYFQPGHDPDFHYDFQVWLEFENVGQIGNLGALRKDVIFTYNATELGLIVSDAQGHSLPRVEPSVIDEIIPGYELCIPFGGNLAFPIGDGWEDVSHFSFSPDSPLQPAQLKGKYFKITFTFGWVIPAGNPGIFYLSGTFTSNKREEERRVPGFSRHYLVSPSWEGTLVLPPVQVPSY